jgi:hypothetical protein
VYGTNVSLEGVNLAPLESTNQAYQLPVAIIKDDLRFHGTSGAVVRGMTMVYDEFELKQGPTTETFALTGNLFTSGLALRGRSTGVLTESQWAADFQEWQDATGGGLLATLLSSLLNSVKSLLGLGGSDSVYFPEWMQAQRGLTVQPKLLFEPETSGVRPHWQNWSQPIYQKDPADAGLRWNLVRWTESS